MRDRDIRARLTRAAHAAGLAPEQLGDDAVRIAVEGGAITLGYAGDEVEPDDLDDAIAQIRAWAEDLDRPWEPGAIVSFTRAVARLVAGRSFSELAAAGSFWDRVAELEEAASLTSLGAEPTDVTAEVEGEVLGYYADPNDQVWCVFVDGDDEVGYVAASATD